MSTLSSNLSSLSTSPIVRKGALSSRLASSAASLASEPAASVGEIAEWACPACGGGAGSGRVVRPCCAARVCGACDRSIGEPKPREVAGRAAGPYLFFAADDDLHADEPPAPACPACGGAVLAATDVVAALERHAERDAPAALCALGALLQTGDALLGVARAPDRAAALYGRAAALGDADAMNAMGGLYLAGVGVDRDDDRAAACFAMAAERDDPRGSFNLGVCYDAGIGRHTDPAEAAFLWSVAASRGHAAAAAALATGWEPCLSTVRESAPLVES